VRYDVYTAHPNDLAVLREIYKGVVPEASGPQKIYVSRSGQRRYLQEADLVSVLRERGFHILEDKPRSAVEQIQMFAGAKEIVGPHGAAFGNLLFSRRASLFEFQHPGWAQPCFRYVCHLMGHRYRVAISEKGKLRVDPYAGVSEAAY